MADSAISVHTARGEIQIATDLVIDPTFGPVHLFRVVGGGGAGAGLTDTELRAVPVPVSGPLTDVQARATPLPVSHGGLTDAELRLIPVPISGVITGPLTNAELRAADVPVSLATALGKVLTFVPVAQGAAGTTVLAAADVTKKNKLLGCVLTMSVDGTLKFVDSAGDLSGAMDIAAKGGFVLPTNILPFWKLVRLINRLVLLLLAGPPRALQWC